MISYFYFIPTFSTNKKNFQEKNKVLQKKKYFGSVAVIFLYFFYVIWL